MSRALPERAAWLSLIAYARHAHTDYDQLLASGYDQESARRFVIENINAVLESWGVKRRLGDEVEP